MAIVHKFIIIYFALIVHKSIAFSINRNLCLETLLRFMNDKNSCNFDVSTAQDLFKDVTTCPTKCNFRMNNLKGGSYSLMRIYLTIGNQEIEFYFCPNSPEIDMNLSISCSSWNARNLELNDSCELTEECIRSFSVCLDGKCKCVNGYSAFDSKSCLKDNVPVGGFCSLHEQCTGSNNSGICENGRCTCTKGFTLIDLACEKGNLTLNDSCELTEQCIQPFSVCLDGKCQCLNGFSAFDTNGCLKDPVPVGGFCSLHEQCTGSNNSGVCENGRCTCTEGFKFIVSACEKRNDHQNSLGSLISQQHGTNIGITLGTLFGGFILGVIVTAVVATLMYRRLKCRTLNRKEPDVMFEENREYGTTDGAQISFTNNKKQNVATLSPYSFAKETQGYNLSSKQEDERTDDVYNHLHEQTEQNDDNYDHACAVNNHITDLSDYSNIRDTATFQTSPSNDGDDYSTLRN